MTIAFSVQHGAWGVNCNFRQKETAQRERSGEFAKELRRSDDFRAAVVPEPQ
jgi:hypothetical protein